MSKRNKPRKSAKSDMHQLSAVATFERSLDLQVRADQTVALQQMIGQLAGQLLSNYEPLEMAISLSEQNQTATERSVEITLYWRVTEGEGMHQFKDVILPKRCLKCADFEEANHICGPVTQNLPSEDEAVL